MITFFKSKINCSQPSRFVYTLLQFSFLLTFHPSTILSQNGPPGTKEEFEEMYKKRIRREYINGVYIPVNLGDAFKQLDSKIDKPSKEKFMAISEQDATRKLHFSLGRWMIVNWGFYTGSRFTHYLRGAGITHPDDMAQFVIITYHRYLNDEDLKIKELATNIKARRKAAYKKRLESGTIIYEEIRQRDSIPEKDTGG